MTIITQKMTPKSANIANALNYYWFNLMIIKNIVF